MMNKTTGAILLFILSQSLLFAQQKFTVHGYITESGSGETIIGANIHDVTNKSNGVSSNNYGFWSMTLAEGEYELVFTYTGYTEEHRKIVLNKDLELNVKLKSGLELEEVTISSEEIKKNVRSTEMGTQVINTDIVKRMPALLGEVDILKTLQLLPGVSSATEGTTGLYVRGGGPDQNLVLLDEAIVYNTGHLLGFFSVFNADAIKNTKLIKGSAPAEYGGRISSVIDVQMKEGNNEYYEAEGGIGLISSRLTLQGPIAQNKSSFIVSARRTYALDLAQPFIKNTNFAGTNYYFYDINTKINYRLTNRDRIYLSGYFGRDVFKFSNNDRAFGVKLPYGNATGTLRWNHEIRNDLFSNVSLIVNNYDFRLDAGQEDFSVGVKSGVKDISCKADADYYPNNRHHIKFGMRYTYHRLTPNLVSASNGEVDFSSKLETKFGHESELYFMDDWSLFPGISLNAGLRFSNFIQVGPYTGKVKTYQTGEFVKSYFVPEPRIYFNLSTGPSSSVKGGISVNSQYIHLVSNSGSTLPTDIWVPSTERVKPQLGFQYSLGYFRNLFSNEFEISFESYFKDLYNQLDYRESYVEDFSSEVEREFVSGRGRAYGLELFIARKKGRLNGWIGYTLSRTERWFSEIENGRIFPATYDRPHDLVVVGSYKVSPSWQCSANFIYATGRAYTPIQSLFIIDGRPNVEYGPRNSARLEPYHRLDISMVYDNSSKKISRFHHSWAFSIYNIYNRKNPFFTYTDFSSQIYSGNASARAVKVSIFTIIPSVTYNFSWSSRPKILKNESPI